MKLNRSFFSGAILSAFTILLFAGLEAQDPTPTPAPTPTPEYKNLQTQTWANERVRPRAEQTRNLIALYDSDRSSVDDVYTWLTGDGATAWSDNRIDGVPNLLLPSDILAFNAFEEDVRNYAKNHASWPVVLKACVRPAQ